MKTVVRIFKIFQIFLEKKKKKQKKNSKDLEKVSEFVVIEMHNFVLRPQLVELVVLTSN